MNIEKQIKDLTDAVKRLTEVMEKGYATLNTDPDRLDLMKGEGQLVSAPDPEDPFDERNPEHVITASHVKELAKAKMIAGVERKTIKAMVTKLKAESIADLSSKDLKTLHKQIGVL